MKMEEHIAFLKLLRIPYKEATLRALWHILNDHKEEVNIEDLIKATCVFEKPAPSPIEPVRGYRPRTGYREYRRPRRGYRDRGYRERY